MIYRFYNCVTAHDEYFEFPKGTRMTTVEKAFKGWQIEDQDGDWEEEDAFAMEIIKIEPIKWKKK